MSEFKDPALLSKQYITHKLDNYFAFLIKSKNLDTKFRHAHERILKKTKHTVNLATSIWSLLIGTTKNIRNENFFMVLSS